MISEKNIPQGYLAKIKPLLEAGILFLGAAILDVLLVPYVLLEYGSTAVRWWTPIMLALGQAVVLYMAMMKRVGSPWSIKIRIIYALLAVAIASPSILMLHTCSILTCELEFMSPLFSRAHLTKIDKFIQLPRANYYDIDSLILNPALRISRVKHETVSTGKRTSITYLVSENMYLAQGRYDMWVIRRHRKPLKEVTDEKALINEWIEYDREKNVTLDGFYQNVSKERQFRDRVNNRTLHSQLVSLYEKEYGKSKYSKKVISQPLILYRGSTIEGDPMLYAFVLWGYGFLFMFSIFNRKEEELKVDKDGRYKHVIKQFFDEKKMKMR